MPLPKFKTSAELTNNSTGLVYTEYQKSFLERRKGVVKMLNALWPEGMGGDSDFIREENGQPLHRHEMAPHETGNYRDRVQISHGMDNVVAFFDSNPRGRLQILSPEDNKPHYLSMSDDKSEFIISDDPVPAPPAPQKPSLWDRFKSIFTKVPSVDRYNEQKKVYDSYNRYCKKAQDITGKRAADKLKEEQARQKAEQAKLKEEQAAAKKIEAQEKKLAAQQESKTKKSSSKQAEETFENIQPKNDVAKDFFAKVDAAVAQNDRLKHAGLMAKKSMNKICGGIGTFNSVADNYKSRGTDLTVTHMATITAFNVMKEYPSVLEEFGARPMNLVGKLASGNTEFSRAIGIQSQDGVTKEFVDQFLQTGGESMAKDMKKIMLNDRIAPATKLESNVPEVSNDVPSLGGR